ncbi:hypothetical protein AB0M57_24130 [Streptomyces sp. NPDC051597]|uniref:hypothetical protein n=1 Tax=Streptomyces sp. NPDC051597 TaxID=3155049 RepID=UPI003421C4E5
MAWCRAPTSASTSAFNRARGAGSQAAARCLYLLYLARAEVRTAQHWKQQMQTMPPEPGLPDLPRLPDHLEEALGAWLICASPPLATQNLALLRAICKGQPQPGRQERPALPRPLQRAVAALVAEEDCDLGEVLRPSPELTAELNSFHGRIPPHPAAIAPPPLPRLAQMFGGKQ